MVLPVTLANSIVMLQYSTDCLRMEILNYGLFTRRTFSSTLPYRWPFLTLRKSRIRYQSVATYFGDTMWNKLTRSLIQGIPIAIFSKVYLLSIQARHIASNLHCVLRRHLRHLCTFLIAVNNKLLLERETDWIDKIFPFAPMRLGCNNFFVFRGDRGKVTRKMFGVWSRIKFFPFNKNVWKWIYNIIKTLLLINDE